MAFEAKLSKYAVIASTLQGRIEDGTYARGDWLPSEAQIAAEFNASRQTAVRALNILKQDGWIDSQQGKGYVVRGRPAGSRLGAPDYIEELLNAEETSARLLGVEAVLASPRVADALGVKENSAVFERRRLVSGARGPVALSTAYLPVQIAVAASADGSDPVSGNLRDRIESTRGTRFDFVTERITARPPTADEAELLKMDPSDSVLWLLLTVHAPDGSSLVTYDVVLPGDRHELVDSFALGS
ncbi:GntR family transcriptional regulator [Actinocatenispora rupis]|uniref:Transcriptional regulator n=1 Tax=Actinocatenispora rupis TaxID=519421 RepID=A0A8J3NEJ5_9ACTN|nr:GntR family transcriptional regulator [Actinocatenispora rupis]GID14107.1 transcriptional regulator [Actinocatenispora rupis]